MTEIEQAITSLRNLVECRCDEAYTSRGRHDPYSVCGYAGEVKIVADHVAFIEAKLAKAVEAGQTMDDGCDCERCSKARATLAEIKGETE